MPHADSDRRREVRHPIQTNSVLQPQSHHVSLPATTVNVSGAGALLQLSDPALIRPGDEVTCQLDIPANADAILPCWGIGNVVRVENGRAAVELSVGLFNRPKDPSPPPHRP